MGTICTPQINALTSPDQMQEAPEKSATHFTLYATRAQREQDYFEWYRCYSPDEEVILNARARRPGKPTQVYRGLDEVTPVIDIRNARGFLINGRTEIRMQSDQDLLGSYTRLGAVVDWEGEKRGRWRDARSWSEEFKGNLVEALANAMLGSGDVPTGSGAGNLHLLSDGETILARLQKQRLAFHPDPESAKEPGRIAKFAGKLIPGELGRSVSENLPPFGWRLYVAGNLSPFWSESLLLCVAILRLESLRYSSAS